MFGGSAIGINQIYTSRKWNKTSELTFCYEHTRNGIDLHIGLTIDIETVFGSFDGNVPFTPRDDRPVYCSECFAKMKEEEAATDAE